MFFDDASYSRFVAWMKVVLPLLALGLLSTLFLVARTVDPAQQLPFAEVDVDEIAREQRIGAPDYSGVTAEGAAVSLKAKNASPNAAEEGVVLGERVLGQIEMPGGEVITISANAMQINYSDRVAALWDSVEITSDRGYRMRTQALDVALSETRAVSDTPTVLTHQLGTLSADRFELTGNKGRNSDYLLVFNGRVKLVYVPHE